MRPRKSLMSTGLWDSKSRSCMKRSKRKHLRDK